MASRTRSSTSFIRHRPTIWISAIAAAIIAILVTIIFSLLATQRSTGDDDAGVPTQDLATTTAEPSSTIAMPSPSPSPTAAAAISTPTSTLVAIPTMCEDIYTHDMTPEFAGLVLNPDRPHDPEHQLRGSSDTIAAAYLTDNLALECIWSPPGGASDRVLITDIARIDHPHTDDMIKHLETTGQTCSEQLEGTRCVYETPPSNDGQNGESHLFRADIWIATKWANAGPDGYTADIAAALFH